MKCYCGKGIVYDQKADDDVLIKKGEKWRADVIVFAYVQFRCMLLGYSCWMLSSLAQPVLHEKKWLVEFVFE